GVQTCALPICLTLLAIPVSERSVYVYADMAVADTEARNQLREIPLVSLFGSFAEPVFPLIANTPANTEVHFGSIEQVVMDEWVSGRVVLIDRKSTRLNSSHV